MLNSSDYYEIGLDTDLQALVLRYKRSGTSEEYRSLHVELLEAMERVHVNRMLVHTQHMGAVAPEDQRWLGQSMIPMLAMAALGNYLHVAVIVPDDNIFTQLAVENVEQLCNENRNCTNRNFSNIAAARQWLGEQQLPL